MRVDRKILEPLREVPFSQMSTDALMKLAKDKSTPDMRRQYLAMHCSQIADKYDERNHDYPDWLSVCLFHLNPEIEALNSLEDELRAEQRLGA